MNRFLRFFKRPQYYYMNLGNPCPFEKGDVVASLGGTAVVVTANCKERWRYYILKLFGIREYPVKGLTKFKVL